MNIRLVKSSSVKTRIEFSFEGSRADIADFKGESGEVSVRYDGAATVILVGLGPQSGYAEYCLRSAAANAVRKAAALKRRALSMSFPKGAHGHTAALEGVLLGGYVFDAYLKEKPIGLVYSKSFRPNSLLRISGGPKKYARRSVTRVTW